MKKAWLWGLLLALAAASAAVGAGQPAAAAANAHAAPAAGAEADADPADAEPAPARRGARFVGWWQDAELSAEIGIPAGLRQQLATELENLQISYQITQTRLNEARKKQSAMLADPGESRDQLLAFNRTEILPLSEKMQSLNFEARLLVRSRLDRAQLLEVGKHPQFFSGRWFKASPLPVREGKVAAPKP